MSFEVESNSELTVIIPTYQLHFRFPVQNKIHKQNFLSDTRIGILASIAGPCDFLPFMESHGKKRKHTVPNSDFDEEWKPSSEKTKRNPG
jgi:hypothetical protein